MAQKMMRKGCNRNQSQMDKECECFQSRWRNADVHLPEIGTKSTTITCHGNLQLNKRHHSPSLSWQATSADSAAQKEWRPLREGMGWMAARCFEVCAMHIPHFILRRQVHLRDTRGYAYACQRDHTLASLLHSRRQVSWSQERPAGRPSARDGTDWRCARPETREEKRMWSSFSSGRQPCHRCMNCRCAANTVWA